MTAPDPDRLTCGVCGARVKRHPAGGWFIHASDGVVAACDRDADHRPAPDWSAYPGMTCGICGSAVEGADGVLRHTDREQDTGHEPDPWGRPPDGRHAIASS